MIQTKKIILAIILLFANCNHSTLLPSIETSNNYEASNSQIIFFSLFTLSLLTQGVQTLYNCINPKKVLLGNKPNKLAMCNLSLTKKKIKKILQPISKKLKVKYGKNFLNNINFISSPYLPRAIPKHKTTFSIGSFFTKNHIVMLKTLGNLNFENLEDSEKRLVLAQEIFHIAKNHAAWRAISLFPLPLLAYCYVVMNNLTWSSSALFFFASMILTLILEHSVRLCQKQQAALFAIRITDSPDAAISLLKKEKQHEILYKSILIKEYLKTIKALELEYAQRSHNSPKNRPAWRRIISAVSMKTNLWLTNCGYGLILWANSYMAGV